jgi:hypothetical protein
MSFHKSLRGSDLHAPSNELVENNTGFLISKMTVVALDGMGAIYPQVKINSNVSDRILGVATEDIPNGSSGTICAFGFLFNINTSTFSVSSILYSDGSGQLSTMISGSPVAMVTKSDSTYGVLYVFAGIGILNTDNDWTLEGNSGTNPTTNFLGTIDNNPLNIKTNNELRLKVSELGRLGIGNLEPDRHIHIKTHPGYSKSGLQLETISFTSNNDSYQTIYSVQIHDPSTCKLKIELHARQNDGLQRASFTRTGVFYRNNSNVQAQEFWQSDFTYKTNNSFNIRYILTGNEVEVQVKTPNNTVTYWTGHATVEMLDSST